MWNAKIRKSSVRESYETSVVVFSRRALLDSRRKRTQTKLLGPHSEGRQDEYLWCLYSDDTIVVKS